MVNLVPVTDTNEFVFVSMFSDYIFYDLRKYSSRLLGMYSTKESATTQAYTYIFNYFYNPNKYHIFLIENCMHEFVGFCVLADYPLIDSSFGAFFIEEFYIKDSFRGRGYGDSAVQHIFKMYGTKGSLCILDQNVPALRFWKKVFTKYTTGVQCESDKDFDDLHVYKFTPVIKEFSYA